MEIVENGTILFTSDVATVGNYGSTPWTSFSYTFATGGSYTIQAGVANGTDNAQPSQLGLDNLQLQPAGVPEPASLAGMGFGVLGLGALLLRARKSSKTLS